MSAVRLLAYVPFIAGGVVAAWSLSRDLPTLWRYLVNQIEESDHD